MTFPRRPREVAGKPNFQIFGAATNILLAQVITAGMGYFFWIIVSRSTSVSVTGLASSAISAATATALLSSVGIGYSQLPGAGAAHSRVTARQRPLLGLVATTVASALGALVLLLGSPWLVPELASAPLALRLDVAAISVFTAVGMYLDYVGTAASRSWLMLLRSLLAAVGRLVLVVLWASNLEANGVTFAWMLAMGLSLVPSAVILGRRVEWRPRQEEEVRALSRRERFRAHSRLWLGNHLTCVGGVAAPQLLPVLVLNMLGKHAAGVYYPTWMLGSAFFMISPAVVSAVLSREAHTTRRQELQIFGFASKLTFGLLVLPVLVCIAFPAPLLGIFGEEYARLGPTLLVILACSSVPDAISNIGVALLRSRGRFGASVAVNSAITISTLATTPFLLHLAGIAGAGWSWILGQTVGALMVTPHLLGLWRNRHQQEPEDARTAAQPAETAVGS